MFGYKHLIAEKDARIKDLKEQISRLEKLVFPPDTSKALPFLQVEADAVLSGKDQAFNLTPEEVKQAEDEISERDRILSGQY